MKKASEINFDNQSVAGQYDSLMVPVVFEPWALELVAELDDWEGKTVLDLATGTGVVAKELGGKVGPSGQVTGLDLNEAMLHFARLRCADSPAPTTFIEGSAQSLELPGESIDRIVCQQGYQFFPEKAAATAEMFRVLRPGGQVLVSCWCPVDECDLMAKVCEALEFIEEPGLAQMMQIPFNFMPASELTSLFGYAGFSEIQVRRAEKSLKLPGGVAQGLEIAFGSPISPSLKALSEEKQAAFREDLTARLETLSSGSEAMGNMASQILTARKP